MPEILLWKDAKLTTEDIETADHYKVGAKKGHGPLGGCQLVTTEEELHIVMKDKNDKKNPITGDIAGVIADQLGAAGVPVRRHIT